MISPWREVGQVGALGGGEGLLRQPLELGTGRGPPSLPLGAGLGAGWALAQGEEALWPVPVPSGG